MKKRKLGQLGTEVFPVGYGAMSFSNFYGTATDEQAAAILGKCLDLGIDHLDTADVYGMGKSELRIGAFLSRQGSQAQDMFRIATKAGIARDADGKRYYDNSAEYLGRSLDASLQRLGVDQVELFYVHRRDPATPIEEVAETLAELVKSGKTRQVGFSEIAPTQLDIAQQITPIAAVQSEYSLSTRSPEMGLVQRMAEAGATLVAFSPVGRGLLTDSPPSLEKCGQLDFFKGNPRFQAPNHGRNLEATAPFRALAGDMGTSAATLAVAWLLHQGEHILPIPGTRSVDHLEQVAAAADLILSEGDLKAIEQVLPVGWCHGDRYSVGQWVGPERYC